MFVASGLSIWSRLTDRTQQAQVQTQGISVDQEAGSRTSDTRHPSDLTNAEWDATLNDLSPFSNRDADCPVYEEIGIRLQLTHWRCINAL